MPARPGGSTGPSRAVRSPARTRARSLPARVPPLDYLDEPAGRRCRSTVGAVPDVARGFSRGSGALLMQTVRETGRRRI